MPRDHDPDLERELAMAVFLTVCVQLVLGLAWIVFGIIAVNGGRGGPGDMVFLGGILLANTAVPAAWLARSGHLTLWALVRAAGLNVLALIGCAVFAWLFLG